MEAELEHVLEINNHEKCHRIVLEGVTYSIGRWSRNAIVIDAPEISRQHAILLRLAVPDSNHHVFRLVDGNLKGQQSTNGVFVNGRKQSSHILRHGDEIDFGGRTKARYYCTLKSESTDQSLGKADTVDPFETLMVEQTITATATDAEMARLVSFLELSPHPIIELDLSGKITYLNPASIVEFPNLKQIGIHHPILADLIQSVQAADESSFVREVNLGNSVYQQAIYYLPESQLIRLNMLDITHKKHAEAELLKRDNLLEAIAQATKTLLVELDYEKAVQDVIAMLGEATKVDTILVCQDVSHLGAESPIDFQFEWSANSIPHLRQLLLRHYKVVSTEKEDNWRSILIEGQAIKKGQTALSSTSSENSSHPNITSILLIPLFLKDQYWGFISAADWQCERQWSSHEESSLFTLATNISAALNRKQAEERMLHRALYDPLTELPNRSLFNEQLSFYLKNSHRNENLLAVMFLDLDRFKAINDTLGHTLGDQLLKDAASRISHVLREGDIVARWGGDEFTILLPKIRHINDAADVAERLLQTLEMAFEIEGNELYITGSIGITGLDKNSHDAETMIKHADIALYSAKEKGRNRYEIYNHSLDSKTPELLTLDKDMRRALVQEEFIVHYQPRVDLTGEKIVGIEALVRWQHPELGLVSPKVFISLAEENGLIIPIGEWVLRQACLQNKRWQDEGLTPVIVAVNLSPRQFRQPDLLQRVAAILEETGLDTQYLELEITESEAIHDIEYTTKILEALHNMGIKVSVDDFGTGHSSLNRLQCLPFDNLKIDRSFIRDLIPNTKLSHIVSTIVSLGQKLGMHIVAEGVEEVRQLEFLKSVHCDTVQGFLFYKPISAAAMSMVLQSTTETTEKVRLDVV
ncbi:MAG: EAL domain-containing protein [Cyanobacteria bacterium P01_E01_bin.6]